MKCFKDFAINVSFDTANCNWTYSEIDRSVPINEKGISALYQWIEILIDGKVYEHSPFFNLIDTVESKIQSTKRSIYNCFKQGGILVTIIDSEGLSRLAHDFFCEIRAGNEMELNLKMTCHFSDYYTFRVTEDILIDETRAAIPYFVCTEFFSLDKSQKIHFPTEVVLDENFEGMFATLTIKFLDGSIENANFYFYNIHSYENFLPKWYAEQKQEVVFAPQVLCQSKADEQSWWDYMYGIFDSLQGSSKEEIMLKMARFVQIEDLPKYLNTVLIDSDVVYTLKDNKVEDSDLKKWRPSKNR